MQVIPLNDEIPDHHLGYVCILNKFEENGVNFTLIHKFQCLKESRFGVYLARGTKDEIVILKIVAETNDPKKIEEFEERKNGLIKEYELLEMLNNKNPTRFAKPFIMGNGVFKNKNKEYQIYGICIEYIYGKSLSKINFHEFLREENMAFFLSEMVKNLEPLHAENSCHGDIKLSNLILSFKNDVPRIHLIDYECSSSEIFTNNKIPYGSSQYSYPNPELKEISIYMAEMFAIGITMAKLLGLGDMFGFKNTANLAHNDNKFMNVKTYGNFKQDPYIFLKKLTQNNRLRISGLIEKTEIGKIRAEFWNLLIEILAAPENQNLGKIMNSNFLKIFCDSQLRVLGQKWVTNESINHIKLMNTKKTVEGDPMMATKGASHKWIYSVEVGKREISEIVVQEEEWDLVSSFCDLVIMASDVRILAEELAAVIHKEGKAKNLESIIDDEGSLLLVFEERVEIGIDFYRPKAKPGDAFMPFGIKLVLVDGENDDFELKKSDVVDFLNAYTKPME